MNIFEAYNKTKKELEGYGVEDIVFEAKQIIRHITGLSNKEILLQYNKPLTRFQENNLTALLKQRSLRYPLQYIFGEWSFYGGEFSVGPGVLVPRADTETVLDVALEFLKEKGEVDVLDLCAGSGCIGITIAREVPTFKVTMVEKFPEALRYAEKNITKNNTSNANVVLGDVFEGSENDRSYDLIVSNPPYILKEEMSLINPEAKYEPETALLAKDEGLEFYKAIITNYKKSLKNGGMLLFEVGFSGADKVARLLEDNGFTDINTKEDLNGIKRAVSGFLKQ